MDFELRRDDIEPGPVEDGIGWRVSCPSCGAPIALSDESWIASCVACGERHLYDRERVTAHLSPHTVSTEEAAGSIKRWLREKKHRATALGPVVPVLVPYWRLRSVILDWVRPTSLAESVEAGRGQAVREVLGALIPAVDTGGPAPFPVGGELEDTRTFPARLGFVPEEVRVARLHGDPGRDTDFSHRFARVVGTKAPQRDRHRVTLDERISLLYRPFHLMSYRFRDERYTAVSCGRSGRVLGRSEGDLLARLDLGPAEERLTTPGMPEMVPLGCPECGQPIASARDASVFHCRPCHKDWRPDGLRLVPVDQVFVSGEGLALPFWRVDCHRTDDVGPQGELPPVYVPAFAPCPPSLTRRLAVGVSERFPTYTTRLAPPLERVSATLPAELAVRAAPLILADLEDAGGWGIATTEDVEPRKLALYWIPWKLERGFLSDPVSGMVVSHGVVAD